MLTRQAAQVAPQFVHVDPANPEDVRVSPEGAELLQRSARALAAETGDPGMIEATLTLAAARYVYEESGAQLLA
jgi:hypothetical protein